MIYIDYKDSRPLYEQISSKLSELILHGVFEVDSQLPSVRNLAMELSINPNTIQKAYAELERRGYIYSVKGKGNFVSDIKMLQEERKMDIIKQMQALIEEAKRLGIGLDEIKAVMEQSYGSLDNSEK